MEDVVIEIWEVPHSIQDGDRYGADLVRISDQLVIHRCFGMTRGRAERRARRWLELYYVRWGITRAVAEVN